MRSSLMTLAAVAAIFVPAQASAQVENYKFDNPHTQIIFAVDHLGYTDSMGQFTGYDGHITFDRDQPANSSVEVTIKTDSLSMDHEKWDAHLKGPDFFDVEKFPDMTFKSTKIDVTGDKTADITGDLTILGVTKPVVLHSTFNKADKHPMGDEYHAGFSANAAIKRSDFGMNYGLPMVGDDVKITLNVEAVRLEDGAAEQ